MFRGRGRVQTRKREENIIAVSHVRVLGAEQKSLRDGRIVAYNRHCMC